MVGKQLTLHEIKTSQIMQFFAPTEGFNSFYYGKVRNGKTYTATADIWELLQRGEVVFANWQIDFPGYDERNNFFIVLFKLFFGKKYFYHYLPDNFHFLDMNSPDLVKDLNKLVGAHVFIDEGQWLFNSHLKTDDPEKRRLILEGGHYCRSLNVISQRPTNILKDIRSQIHIWYKCEKKFSGFGLLLFQCYEIQEMKDDVPDEENYERVKVYVARKKIMQSYNTHGFRREDAIIVQPKFNVYRLNLYHKLLALLPRIKKRSRGNNRPHARGLPPRRPAAKRTSGKKI